MTAQEAKDLAKSTNLDKTKGQLKDILEIIAREAKAGSYSAYYYEDLHADVKDYLEGQGYKINSYSDFRNGTTITITWY